MSEFKFKAIGTAWRIISEEVSLKDLDKNTILNQVDIFEKQFSRFLHDSEVNAFSQVKPGVYPISTEFASLLKLADQLRKLTEGRYDPAVSELLERAGYDAVYSLEPKKNIQNFVLPKWELQKAKLKLDGPIKFDLGGIGKGYCIDMVANLLQDMGYKYFIVEAGGDMYVTSKADGSPYRAAITYPGKPELAVGTVELKNQALAVSDSFCRRWQNWHHIVDLKDKQPVASVVGAAAVAKSACYADCMTSALFLAERNFHSKIGAYYNSPYVIFLPEETYSTSGDWKGEFFSTS